MDPEASKILLIEEEKGSMEVLRRFLVPFGYRVFWARNGHEAHIFLRSKSMDLVLIDVEMSDGQGFSTIARMVKDFPSLKIIAGMSCLSQHGFQAKALALNLGACAVIGKPYETDAIRRVLKEVRET